MTTKKRTRAIRHYLRLLSVSLCSIWMPPRPSAALAGERAWGFGSIGLHIYIDEASADKQAPRSVVRSRVHHGGTVMPSQQGPWPLHTMLSTAEAGAGWPGAPACPSCGGGPGGGGRGAGACLRLPDKEGEKGAADARAGCSFSSSPFSAPTMDEGATLPLPLAVAVAVAMPLGLRSRFVLSAEREAESARARSTNGLCVFCFCFDVNALLDELTDACMQEQAMHMPRTRTGRGR